MAMTMMTLQLTVTMTMTSVGHKLILCLFCVDIAGNDVLSVSREHWYIVTIISISATPSPHGYLLCSSKSSTIMDCTPLYPLRHRHVNNTATVVVDVPLSRFSPRDTVINMVCLLARPHVNNMPWV
jgi:hypothetical protein